MAPRRRFSRPTGWVALAMCMTPTNAGATPPPIDDGGFVASKVGFALRPCNNDTGALRMGVSAGYLFSTARGFKAMVGAGFDHLAFFPRPRDRPYGVLYTVGPDVRIGGGTDPTFIYFKTRPGVLLEPDSSDRVYPLGVRRTKAISRVRPLTPHPRFTLQFGPHRPTVSALRATVSAVCWVRRKCSMPHGSTTR